MIIVNKITYLQDLQILLLTQAKINLIGSLLPNSNLVIFKNNCRSKKENY